MARYFQWKKDFARALTHSNHCLALYNDSNKREQLALWELHLLHGNLLMKLKHSREALGHLLQAWNENKKSKYIALNLSQAHMALLDEKNSQSKHLESALDFANKALKLSEYQSNNLHPDSDSASSWAPAWNQRAVVYMRQKKYKKARLDLLKAIEIKPDFARAHYNLALCSSLLSLYYLSPQTKSGEKSISFRSEAIRAWQELKLLDPVMAKMLYEKAGFQNIVEGTGP
jgi:tetratricopeptide (TPR) repeat protein